MSKNARGFDYWERKLKLWLVLHKNDRKALGECHKCPYRVSMPPSRTRCPNSRMMANSNLEITSASAVKYGLKDIYWTTFHHAMDCVEWIKYE